MIKKKNHYKSRFYIEAFSDQNGFVWTYPKMDPARLFSGKPENTACKNKLYHLNLDGLDTKPKIDIIENFLADHIESPAANALKALREKKFPSEEERKNLSVFFGILFTRTPTQIENLKNLLDGDFERMSTLLASNKESYHNLFRRRPNMLRIFETLPPNPFITA